MAGPPTDEYGREIRYVTEYVCVNTSSNCNCEAEQDTLKENMFLKRENARLLREIHQLRNRRK